MLSLALAAGSFILYATHQTWRYIKRKPYLPDATFWFLISLMIALILHMKLGV